jgi:hypothetical protein
MPTDPRSNANTDTYIDSNSNSNSNSNSYSYSYSHGHGYTNSDGYANSDGDGCGDHDTGAYTNANGYGYRNGDAGAYPNPDTDTWSNLRPNTCRDGQLVATGRQCHGYFRPEHRNDAGRSYIWARESRPGHERQRDQRNFCARQFVLELWSGRELLHRRLDQDQ